MKIGEVSVDWRHLPNKKKTLCTITVGETQVEGHSVVHKGDAYCKKTGRKISFSRAMQVINKDNILDKGQRTGLWNALKEKGVKLV